MSIGLVRLIVNAHRPSTVLIWTLHTVFQTSFGGNGFQGFGGGGAQHRARAAAARARQNAGGNNNGGGNGQTSPLTTILPLILLFTFFILSQLPSLLSEQDPNYSWSPQGKYTTPRNTYDYNTEYFVSKADWDKSKIYQSIPEERRGDRRAGKYSDKLRRYERSIDQSYTSLLQNQVSTSFNPTSVLLLREAILALGFGIHTFFLW